MNMHARLPRTALGGAGPLGWALVALLALLPMTGGQALAQGAPDQPPGENAPGDAPGSAEARPDAADAEATDIEALRREYLRLREELFRSRARAAAVASAMYSTRLQIHLRYDSARFYSITRATIRLDGASVFDDTSDVLTTNNAPRFEGFVAPGRHVVTIRIEATAKDDDRFTSVMEHSVTIQAPAGKDVIVNARARDSGDIPYAWQRKESGSYQLNLDVKIDTRARQEATGARPAGARSAAARPAGARPAAARPAAARPARAAATRTAGARR